MKDLKYKNLMITVATLAFSIFTTTSSFAKGSDFKITDPNLGHQIFTDALNAKDIEKLVAIYADDAVMRAPGNKEIRGKKQIRMFFEKVIPMIDKITLDTVFRINYTDTVVFRSKYTVVYKNPDGTTTSQSTSGIEVEQKQKDGTWLFIVDHHYGGADFADYQQLDKPE